MGSIYSVDCVIPGSVTKEIDVVTREYDPNFLTTIHSKIAKKIGGEAYVDILGFPCGPTMELSADKVAAYGLPSNFVFSRTGVATYFDQAGVRQSAATGVLRQEFGVSSRDRKGILIEAGKSQYLWNNSSPATQTRTLTGPAYYSVWMEGTGSVVVSGGPSGTATAGNPFYFTLASNTDVTFTVVGSVTAFQCENGTTISSFIPTAGATTIRNNDVLYSATASSNYNATEGTVYHEGCFINEKTSGLSRLISLYDNSVNNGMSICRHNTSKNRICGYVIVAGVAVYSFYVNNIVYPLTYIKSAFSYGPDGFRWFINGKNYGASGNIAIPTVARFEIGRGMGAYQEPTYTKQALYFPKQLPDWCLQLLTKNAG